MKPSEIGKTNDIVMSWLLNSVEKDIADSLLYCGNAREVWFKLENRYGQ